MTSPRFAALITLLTAAAAHAGAPPGYYNSTTGLTGAALRAELHRLVKTPHVPLTYSGTRAALEVCDQDPDNESNVILIYTRRSEPKPCPPSSAAQRSSNAAVVGFERRV